MKDSLTIGITGGIGSGKSYICQILETMGYPVFYSDQEAKNILITSPEVIAQITELFGKEAYQNKTLNKTFIASLIFENAELREKMNAIVHPAVRKAFAKFKLESKSPLVFNEAAILFETGTYKNFDFTVIVTANKELRIERIQKRDEISRDEILKRMESQWPDEQKIKLADFVIYNENSELLLPQLIKTINQIKYEHSNLFN